MKTLIELRKSIEQKKGKRDFIEHEIARTQKELAETTKELRFTQQAQEIVQAVAQETQSQIKYHITDIVSLALDIGLTTKYKFNMDFVLRRGKTECDLSIVDEAGNSYNPLTDNGGGVCDIVSFALRIALLAICKRQVRNILILDEPMKWLSSDLIPKAGELFKELSQKLGIQFLIVTHIKELMDYADKIFTVEKGLNNESVVKEETQ